jgi:hypothetical protein
MNNNHPERRPFKFVPWAMALMLLIVFGSWAANEWFAAAAAADHSAHAALAQEICEKLAAVPQGQAYPNSLKELHLSFPDGGDPSLLNRFEYRSTGRSCTVGTVLRGEKIVRSFPGITD